MLTLKPSPKRRSLESSASSLWQLLTTALPVVWASHMILVAFLRVIPGTTLLRTSTTRGIELFQSLWKITFHGGSGSGSRLVGARFSLLCFVADMWRAFCHSSPAGAWFERRIFLDNSEYFLEAPQAEVAE